MVPLISLAEGTSKTRKKKRLCILVQNHVLCKRTELQCWLGSGDLGFWYCYLLISISHCLWKAWPALCIYKNSNRKCSSSAIGAAQITSSVLPHWVRVVEAAGRLKGVSRIIWRPFLQNTDKLYMEKKHVHVSTTLLSWLCNHPPFLKEISFEFLTHWFAVKVLHLQIVTYFVK